VGITATPASPKATILIVDDEPDVRDVLHEYFLSCGYAAMAAESAQVARGMAGKQPIDVALIDIHMPGEDGLSLARHLRERYANVGIVMLTSASRWARTTTCPSLSIRASCSRA
jgi:two-component system phosphate regulon response regulator OmpR